MGREQAIAAAERLLAQVQGEGGVIKFLSSRTKRAVQTTEVMQGYIERAISERKISNLKLSISRERSAITAAGVVGPLKKLGIKDPVEYWLTNPNVLEGKTPNEISGRVKQMLAVLKKVADRLPPGERIHYVSVTHEVPQAAIIHLAMNKTLNELGGNIENCESFRVQIEGGSGKNPEVNFRNYQAELPLYE